MLTERAASVGEVEQSSSERVFIFYESSTPPFDHNSTPDMKLQFVREENKFINGFRIYVKTD